METETIPSPSTFSFNNAEIAQRYQGILVPTFFRPWAEVLLTYTGMSTSDQVLDVATGTGIVAMRAADRIPASQITGCDPADIMLNQAIQAEDSKARQITWKLAPAEALPYPAEEFDVVLCQQGLQFTQDREQAAREMSRVLKRGGRIGLAVWASIEFNTVFHAMQRALIAGLGVEAGQAITKPFSFGSLSDLSSLVSGVGLQILAADTFEMPVIYSGGPNQVYDSFFAIAVGALLNHADESSREVVRASLIEELRPMTHGHQVVGRMRAHLVRATKSSSEEVWPIG